MTDMKKILLFSLLVLVLLLSIAGIYQYTQQPEVKAPKVTSAIDQALDFAQNWHDVRVNNSSDASNNFLAASELLTDGLKARLTATYTSDFDPILCTNPLPERIAAKVIYEQSDEAEVMIFARDGEDFMAKPAIFKMTRSENRWTIFDILCSQGETAPTEEFSFNQSGQLLRNVPSPYQNGVLHIVFEQDGKAGYVAPLQFSDLSACQLSENAPWETCDPQKLMDTTFVTVQGQMLESGVSVQFLTVR